MIPIRRVGVLLALFVVVWPCVASADPSYGVSLSASLWADFEASPTLHLSRPDISGGTNVLLTTGDLEQTNVGDYFHEIYVGSGESGTSSFEVEFDGFANLNGTGDLDIDLLAVDHNNATASYWTAIGSASYFEWLEFSGPTDPDGNYVISFTTRLGTFLGGNTQPEGYTNIWRATANATLLADPLEDGFPTLALAAFATLTKGCESLGSPPCFGHSRLLIAEGEVTVPGSNPVLLFSHTLYVTARSADVRMSGTSLSIDLPTGVTATAYQPLPEPAIALLQFTALAALLLVRSKWGRGSAWGFVNSRR